MPHLGRKPASVLRLVFLFLFVSPTLYHLSWHANKQTEHKTKKNKRMKNSNHRKTRPHRPEIKHWPANEIGQPLADNYCERGKFTKMAVHKTERYSRLSFSLSVSLSLSVCLSICLSVCLSVCLSLCLCALSSCQLPVAIYGNTVFHC